MEGSAMAGRLTQHFDQAREAMTELGYRLDPSKINPETLSGVCRMIGEALQCLGLAKNERDDNSLLPDENDLAVG